MTRSEVLKKADSIINGERDKQYGAPEDNLATIAALWEKQERDKGCKCYDKTLRKAWIDTGALYCQLCGGRLEREGQRAMVVLLPRTEGGGGHNEAGY